MAIYAETHKRSLAEPEAFWAEAAQSISWDKAWDQVCDFSNPPAAAWFKGGKLNTCYNAIDRHIEAGRGDQVALIYDSPVSGQKQNFTYKDLGQRIAKIAGMIAEQGVSKGDRVIIYMPMIPEAVMAMLACARIGAVHSVVFGGFAANELATRIDDAGAKLILAASCGIEPNRRVDYKPLLDKALELTTHQPDGLIVLQRPQCIAALKAGRDFDWQDLEAKAQPRDCLALDANDPLYILYTSGSTGAPKGIVRENAGHAVALHWTMKNLYGIEAGEVFWAASDVGWVVGHSYIVYAPLLAGCTTLLYEGKPVDTPDAGAFWRVLAEHKVKAMFTAPTALRAIKQQDPQGSLIKDYDLRHFETLFVAGERCDPDTLHWCERSLSVPVIDHWWQTETGWAICANFMGLEPLPVKAGSSSLPSPGWDMAVLNGEGKQMKPGEIGALVAKLPLPPSCFATIWNAHERFISSYMADYPGYYATGDAGMIDEDGYLYVMSRTDDVINTAGHRLSTGQMEEILCNHKDVAEAAVLGVEDELKGQLPLGLVVLNAGCQTPHDQLKAELIQMVRDTLGPVAAFKLAAVVKRLPKTRSGKILRGTLRSMADGQPWNMPATIDDPATLDEIRPVLKDLGYAQS